MTDEITSVPESALLTETRNLLVHRPRTLTLLDVANGTTLSVDFLMRITTGKTEHPSVNKIEHLNKWLKANLS